MRNFVVCSVELLRSFEIIPVWIPSDLCGIQKVIHKRFLDTY